MAWGSVGQRVAVGRCGVGWRRVAQGSVAVWGDAGRHRAVVEAHQVFHSVAASLRSQPWFRFISCSCKWYVVR